MAAAKPGKVKKTGAPKGKFVCARCGREFAMAMHLARHQTATHGAGRKKRVVAKKKVGRPRRKAKKAVRKVPRKRRARSPVNISKLSVDQLLALKAAVQARLAIIAEQLRQASVR